MAEFNGVYSPGDVVLVVGTRTMQGFADGTFIEVERAKGDEFTTKVGAKGEGTFVENLDKSGKIKFHIKQNASEEHEFMQSLYASKSIFPVVMTRTRDGHTEKAISPQSMIGVRPRKSMSQDEENRVYEIACIRIDENDTAA